MDPITSLLNNIKDDWFLMAVVDDFIDLLRDVIEAISSDAGDWLELVLEGREGVLLGVLEHEANLVLELVAPVGLAQNGELEGRSLLQDCELVQVDVGQRRELVTLVTQVLYLCHLSNIIQHQTHPDPYRVYLRFHAHGLRVFVRKTSRISPQLIMEYLNLAKNWIATPKGGIVVSSTLAVLTGIRLWARGTTCSADRDISGQVIVITGANTGIGKETMRELAKRPCTIIFGARDARKSEEAIKEILRENKEARLHFYPLDLGDKSSIKEFSQRVKQQTEKIDILINNAGVMAIPERKVTVDGFQMQMGTNHFGHFYLTSLLWDKLKQSEGFRVINVSSRAHKGMGFPKKNLKIDFDDINFKDGYTPGEAYGRSKAANILFTRELQKRIDQAGLNGIAVSLHPGVVRTELARNFSWKILLVKAIFTPFLYLVMKSPWEGAQTTLHTALQESAKLKKGEYYDECRVTETTLFSQSLENAEQLWKVTERELGIQFKV